MEKRQLKIMIVAGEASGDLHAAKLVKAFRESSPEATFELFGSAGKLMREAGVESVVDADGLSIVGLLEIGRSLPMFLKAFQRLKAAALERKPDVIVLVDFPDFNLKLAKSLSKRSFKIAYYISPQLWAWRGYRIRSVRNYVDLMISILPFEKGWYASRGVEHVEYVGSPLAREVYPTEDKLKFASRHELDPEKPIVAFLPGSRHKEIVRILPVMLGAVSKMVQTRNDLQFVIAAGSEKNRIDIEKTIHGAGFESSAKTIVVSNETFNALNASDAAAVASGTATLETGLIGTPMAIVYKTSAINYGLLRPLIDVDHFGLVNLIAGERVAAELIQDDFSADSLSKELFRLLDPSQNQTAREKLRSAADKLGHGGASKRAAELIIKLIDPER